MLFNGTSEEFEAIVNKNKLLLYSIAYAVAGNASVDDIVQETFIYAYYNFGKLKCKEKLSTWLCAIARNKAYDYLKRSRRTGQVSMEHLAETDEELVSSADSPELMAMQNETRAKLLAEVNSLSEKYRETVLLYYFADMSIREISELLSVPEGTVKFRLSDARKKLKKELKGMFNEERANIVNKDIYKKIEEETIKAEKALKEYNNKAASELCDALLKDIEELSPKTPEELAILSRFYQAKITTIMYTEGVSAADEYLKKTVEMAEASKDLLWISGAYSFYAAQLSNMGRDDEAARYHKMALEKAQEAGNKSYIADKLYWCGINAYNNKTDRYGLDYFEQVLSMKDELLADEEHKIMNIHTYALSYSAYVALTRCGESVSKLDSFHSITPSVAISTDGFYLAGEPGISGDGDYCGDLFYYIGKIAPFLSDNITAGYSFEKNTFSHSKKPIRTRFDVISMDEAITVPAGSFEHCLHTRYTSYIEDDDCERNKRRNGVTDIWYAPEVGVVSMTFTPICGNGHKNMKLDSYKVQASKDGGLALRYLPLVIGNKWSYVSYDANGHPYSDTYDYENLFELVCWRQYDNAAVIAYSGWGVKK